MIRIMKNGILKLLRQHENETEFDGMAVNEVNYNDLADDLLKTIKEKWGLFYVSKQRELLIDFADDINVHDGDRVKIAKLVDTVMKNK